MKKTLLSIVLLGASLLSFSQNETTLAANSQDQVLMTINGEPIMASEFLYIYEKNNQEQYFAFFRLPILFMITGRPIMIIYINYSKFMFFYPINQNSIFLSFF